MNVALCADDINILSLCAGGAGLDLGVELAIEGACTVCMVEREAFAAFTLVSAMQNGLLAPAPIWSDARTFDGRAWRGVVDGLIGGIPCQPHSLAGKRRGEEDERDLWSDARRIIVQSGAWFVLIENVRGMLSARGDLDPGAFRVWRDLQRLGFAVEGGLFTASEVGASHERERIFILAVADARRARSQGSEWRGASQQRDGRPASEAVAEFRGASLADAGCGRLGTGLERDLGAEGQSGSTLAAAPDGQMADASRTRGRGLYPRSRPSDEAARKPDRPGLFPPGPDDLLGWRDVLGCAPELEPAFRRVADGMAARMDFARVDRIRMLGNGVVPLEAGYAFRTLGSRLAAAGSAGAAELVLRMAG